MACCMCQCLALRPVSMLQMEAVDELLSDEEFKNDILALLIFCGAMELREGAELGVYYLKVKVNML